MPRAIVLAGILTLAGASLPAQDAPTVRVSTDLIHFGVTVTDKSGALVRGLAADDFEIIEDGRPQAIRAFAVGADAAPDLHVGLMFDLSESMLHDIDQARTAASAFSTSYRRLPTSRSSISPRRSAWRGSRTPISRGSSSAFAPPGWTG